MTKCERRSRAWAYAGKVSAQAVLGLTLMLCIAAQVATAQDSTAVQRNDWLVGVSIGVPRAGGAAIAELSTVSGHWTQLRLNRPGADFSFGLIPRFLPQGLLAAAARAGVALPIELAPSVVLIPSGGASLLGGAGSGGAGATAGYNGGVAALLRGTTGAGLRAGVTWHRFSDFLGSVWLIEVGIVRGRRPSS